LIRHYIINFFLILFLLPSISYSKIITLKDCRYSWEKTFQKDLYEYNKIVIDIENKNITHLVMLIDKELEANKKLNKFEYKTISVNMDSKNEFKIFKGEKNKNTIDIILKEKKIEQIFYSPITNKKITIIIYCD
jgi:hypothetical protein